MKFDCFYTEIDAILDTRIATVAKISADLAVKVLLGNYHDRDSDNFKHVDKTTYKAAYKARDTETMKLAAPTEGINMMRDIIAGMLRESQTDPSHTKVKLVVNCYPYRLDKDEKEVLSEVLTELTDWQVEVELVYIPLEFLTPSYCKSQFKFMFTYEYEIWLEMHTEEFRHVRMPEVTYFAPAIYFTQVPTEKELASLEKGTPHPMESTELLMNQFVNLQLIDIKYFCIVDPRAA